MPDRTLRIAITRTSARAIRPRLDELDEFLDDQPGAEIVRLEVKKGTSGGVTTDQLVITVRT